MAIDKTKGEFSGGPGLVQREQVGHETEVQQLWEVYGTDENRRDRLGEPLAENVGRQPRTAH